MAKKETKPFSGVRIDFEDSLQAYMLAAGGLAAAVDTVLTIAKNPNHKLPDAFKDVLQEALTKFEQVR